MRSGATNGNFVRWGLRPQLDEMNRLMVGIHESKRAKATTPDWVAP